MAPKTGLVLDMSRGPSKESGCDLRGLRSGVLGSVTVCREGGGDGREKLVTSPEPDEAVEPLSLWSSLPHPQGHMVMREAAGLNAGFLNL